MQSRNWKRWTQPFVPYIYSREELLRLLDATSLCEHPRSKVRTYTYRTLILLLYGAGLPISEALTLTLNDVSLSRGVIQIRESKFYKTRLVPVRRDLVNALTCYASQRKKDHSAQPDTPFLHLPYRKWSNTTGRRCHLQSVASSCQSATPRWGTLPVTPS